jgi:hypothetical protein
MINSNVDKIKEVYERVLGEEKADFICLSQKYDQVLGDWYDANFAPRLMGGKIRTRELLPNTQSNRDYAKTKAATKNLVRYLEGELSETDVIIAPNWAALVSLEPSNPLVIMIGEAEIVKGLHNQFEREWQAART